MTIYKIYLANINVDGKVIKAQIWDTAGEERSGRLKLTWSMSHDL
ncbi:putative small GTPase, P-loop containing nucleoside triphosphate hydrolase [Helianthus annuus]|nr:putative small GTPase, P-loop containing nucleoside triphosphate hydrolase [Helianthus annuus]